MAQTYGPQVAPNFQPTTPQVFDKKKYLADKGYSDTQAGAMMAGVNPSLIAPERVQTVAKPKQGPVVDQAAGMAVRGASVSPGTLEKLRANGVPDDVIADEMAKTSTHFASQLKKIRTAYQNDPAGTSAFLNTRFYGDTQYNPVSKTAGDVPTPPKPKNYLTKTLDHIYQQAEDVLGEGGIMAQYNQGDIGAGDAAVRTAGKVFHAALTPVLDPLADVTKMALDKTGASALIQSGMQSVADSQIGQAITPQIQNAIEAYNNLPAGSNWRNLAVVGQAGLDAFSVVGAQGAMDMGKRAINQGVTRPWQSIRHPIQSAKGVWTGNMPSQANAVQTGTSATKELMGPAKQAVQKGMDEKFMTFAAEQNPNTRAVMAKMTEAAHEGGKVLGGTVKHKEILGGQMMDNAAFLLERKSTIGKALSAMKGSVADDIIDLTDDYDNLIATLRDKGAVINDKGVIVALAGAADDNIPQLQKILSFLQPDDLGRVTKTGKQIDQWRTKMFEEINSAKAKLQPSSAGQSTLGFAEKVTNDVRRSALLKMAKENGNLVRANDAYEELSTAASQYLKAIGYKGKLNVDAITAKELRAGEVALRTLGNASADTRDAFLKLIETAQKYGRVSNVDDMALIKYADALEDVFPVTPTRSLQGAVSRGVKDATGQFTEDAVRGGVKRAVLNRAAEGIIDKIDQMRGMTPENRFRLLMEVLNAPEDTPLIQIINKVSEAPVTKAMQDAVRGVDAGDLAPAAREQIDNLDDIPLSQLSPQGMADAEKAKEVLSAGGTVDDAAKVSSDLAKKFPNLTTEEIANLTPEEKATGLLGGGDGGIPSALQSKIDQAKRGVKYFRNTEKAPNKGMKFGQDIEPTGKYMNLADEGQSLDNLPKTWEVGEIKFNNPLVIELKTTGHGGWKTDLSNRYGGLTGKKLSKAIVNDGYDGIITYDGANTAEVVSLKDFVESTLPSVRKSKTSK
ncbi:hypothetical protein [Caudoviricetes sp.]|nr:hypothetical protein [Caudoviricetes sp.]